MSCKELIREIRALRGWRDANRVGDDHLNGQVDLDFYSLSDLANGENVERRTEYLRRITEAEERLVFGFSTTQGNTEANNPKLGGNSFAEYLTLVLSGLYDESEPAKPLLGTLIETQTVDAGSLGVYDTAALLLQIKEKLDSIGTVVEADTARDVLIQIRELLK